MERELYQELILDHNRTPRNRRAIEHPDASAEGHNPLCGDEVTIYMDLEGDAIRDISFEGHGCAISTASASLMTEALRGLSISDALEIFERFHRMVTEEDASSDLGEPFEKLEAFAGVREFPARVKCATLAWHTMQAALQGKREATTE